MRLCRLCVRFFRDPLPNRTRITESPSICLTIQAPDGVVCLRCHMLPSRQSNEHPFARSRRAAGNPPRTGNLPDRSRPGPGCPGGTPAPRQRHRRHRFQGQRRLLLPDDLHSRPPARPAGLRGRGKGRLPRAHLQRPARDARRTGPAQPVHGAGQLQRHAGRHPQPLRRPRSGRVGQGRRAHHRVRAGRQPGVQGRPRQRRPDSQDQRRDHRKDAAFRRHPRAQGQARRVHHDANPAAREQGSARFHDGRARRSRWKASRMRTWSILR